MSNIAIFGDSIVHGSVDLERGGWSERLKVDLWGDGQRNALSVYAFGVSGGTTDDLLKRFEVELASILYGTEAIIFAIGINDAVRNSTDVVEVDRNTFKSNIEELLSLAQESAVPIYVCGLTRVEEQYTNPLTGSSTGKCYQNSRINDYDEILHLVTKEKKCHYIKLKDVLEKGDLFDGLHPNAQGHEKIFKHVKQVLVDTNII